MNVCISFRTIFTQSDDILQDLRRLNVAITRAKHKLILIGSVRILRSYQPLDELVQLLTNDQVSFP